MWGEAAAMLWLVIKGATPDLHLRPQRRAQLPIRLHSGLSLEYPRRRKMHATNLLPAAAENFGGLIGLAILNGN
jgi:hypothetical protein